MVSHGVQGCPRVSLSTPRPGNDYFESNVLANPPLPGAVKLGIGNFASLFGTDKGLDLRQIASKFQWPLFWAYGEGIQTGLDSILALTSTLIDLAG